MSRHLLLATTLLLATVLAACSLVPGPRPTPRATPRPGQTPAGEVATPTPAPAPTQPTATPAVQPSATPAPQRASKWGVHLLLDDGVSQWPVEVWDQHLDYARRLVGPRGYVVELIRANDLDAAKWQRFLDAAAIRQLNVIIRLATWQDRQAGHWVAPPLDPDGKNYRVIADHFAAFLGRLRYPVPLYVTVGNEPNRGDEWGGQPDPAQYAQYLLDVSAALRTAAPGRVRILNAGLDQYAPNTRGEQINGFRAIDAATFLDGMQAASPTVWQSIDAWATHAYPLGPFSQPPAERRFQIDDLILGGPVTDTPPWPGLFNRGLNGYHWELFKLRSYGVTRDLEVFITETGWRQRQSQQPSADSAGALLDGDDVARYIQLAFDGDPHLDPYAYTWTPWNQDGLVRAAALFALGGDPSRWGHTNLVRLTAGGRIAGFRDGLGSLVKR